MIREKLTGCRSVFSPKEHSMTKNKYPGLFKKTITRYVDPNGKRATKDTDGATKVTTKSSTWYCRVRDARGLLHEFKLFTDAKASNEKRSTLIRNAERGESGLLSPFEAQLKRPIKEHMAEFINDLRNQGRTDDHCDLRHTHISFLIKESKARFIRDLSASKIRSAIAKIKEKGRSQQTCNHYLKSIKHFTGWLVSDRRTDEDVLKFLDTGSVDADGRIVRRELSDGEIRLLLDAARTGKPYLGLTGYQRFTLYATALGTGLRASELASLRCRSFNMDDDIPTVTIEAKSEKARRGAVLPLVGALADLLRPWLKTIGADEPLWPGVWAEQKRGSKFMQFDLGNARLAWLETADNDQQRVEMESTDFLQYRNRIGEQADFHALRHTCGSRLHRAGSSTKETQMMMRHADPSITLRTYVHSNLQDLAGAIAKQAPLPIPIGGGSQALVARLVAPVRDDSSNLVMIADDKPLKGDDPPKKAEPPTKHVVSLGAQAERVRFELTMPSRTCRFSRPVQSATLPPLR